MPVAVVIFAVAVGLAGAYYLFFSRSAKLLSGIEGDATNDRRHRLRRANGAALLVLAPLLLAGFALNEHRHPWLFIFDWVAVVLLLAVVMALASIDVRLTARFRRRFRP